MDCLSTLESPPTPELPEPHDRENQGEAEEQVLKRSRGYAGADDGIGVIHHDRFPIRAQVGQPPIGQKLEGENDRI